MPYEVAIPAIEAALRALMVASTPLTALLATKSTAQGGGPAIYNEGAVPQGAPLPYLTIGAWTQIPFHSLTPDGDAYGWNCTGQIKAVGQLSATYSESSLMALLSKVFAVLPQGLRLTVSGYGSAWCDEFTLQPTLKSVINGVTTFELPAILRVYVHDK